MNLASHAFTKNDKVQRLDHIITGVIKKPQGI